MRIDPLERTVRLSVRELAAFRQRPASGRGNDGRWRAEAGRRWHKESEERTRRKLPAARFEVPLDARWREGDWRFHFQGRMDQVLPCGEGGSLIREIKTVRAPLPLSPEELLEQYPDHFAQAATYLALAAVLPEFAGASLSAEIVFIDLDTGIEQVQPIGPEEATFFARQLGKLLPFLDDRRDRRLTLRDLALRPAFETLRPGQAELLQTLQEAALGAQTVLLEAPTGFGKTGIVLEHALNRLCDGLYERLVYLSSKSTGQIQTVDQLRAMIGGEVRYIQMRNRSEHAIDTAAHRCTGDARCDDDLGQRWREADVHPPELFAGGTLELERARSMGASTGVCPYALTRACLPFAEVWIGDSNYVFSPGSRSVFLEAIGFDPARTLLVIDEAHNLPDRTADALSLSLRAEHLANALQDLRTGGAARRLLATGDALVDALGALATCPRVPLETHYALLDLCEDFARQLEEARFDYESVSPDALEAVWTVPGLAERLESGGDDWLAWSPHAGELRLTCLNAGPWIGECLAPFGGAVLMSATLNPLDSFRTACGLAGDNATYAIGHAGWRDKAYDVAIDVRVDTRFRARPKTYETTARTVASLGAASPGMPVAVFFPSYKYAEAVAAYLEVVDPGLQVLIQPRGLDLAGQEQFIKEGLLLAGALFLILGSSYAEGIDQLGGRIRYALVAGPALPEVNPVQEARMERLADAGREAAFSEVYIVPGMRRIQQALGRLVRAPGQSARVVLHGRRFAQPAYREQLAPEYAGSLEIRTDADLVDWLSAE